MNRFSAAATRPSPTGLVFRCRPNYSDTNSAAKSVGVYSGANLLLYVLSVSFVAFVLNQYVHNGDAHERVILLTRKLAILEAQNRRLESKIRSESGEK